MPFQPGQSGNPSGRPKENAQLKAAARAHTEAALNVLVMALGDEDTKTRIAAANALLDRGYGKPTQAVGGDPDFAPLVTNISVEYVKATGGLPVPPTATS